MLPLLTFTQDKLKLELDDLFPNKHIYMKINCKFNTNWCPSLAGGTTHIHLHRLMPKFHKYSTFSLRNQPLTSIIPKVKRMKERVGWVGVWKINQK